MKHNKKAMTLVEVMVAFFVFGVVSLGLLAMSSNTRLIARKNLVKELAIAAAESRLSQILATKFTDPELENRTKNKFKDKGEELIEDFYQDHNPDKYTFDKSNCGIYTGKPPDDKLDESLGQEEIGWVQRYSDHLTRMVPDIRPFPIIEILSPPVVTEKPYQPVKRYMGKEINDFFPASYYDPVSPIKIFKKDIELSTIDNSSKDQNQYGYIYCDDVDDFDGLNYKIFDVFDGINFHVEVAVRPHYRKDRTELGYLDKDNDYIYDKLADNSAPEGPKRKPPQSLNPKDKSYPGTPKKIHSGWDMGEISIDSMNNLFDELDQSDEDEFKCLKKMTLDYYRDCVYKEIIVTVTYRYPDNDDIPYQSVSLYGLVPSEDNLIMEKTVDMASIFDIDVA